MEDIADSSLILHMEIDGSISAPRTLGKVNKNLLHSNIVGQTGQYEKDKPTEDLAIARNTVVNGNQNNFSEQGGEKKIY